MQKINTTTKITHMLLQDNNSRIQHTACYAVLLLGIVTLLIGCPDSMDNDNGDGNTNGTATQNTAVQNAAGDGGSADTITLRWNLPTDTVGFLGVTISEKDNSGSLSDSVDIAAETTTYQVTALEAGTTYTFTIATRYTASGKNNNTTVTATTASVTQVQSVVLNNSATTSDSVTIIWEDPVDTTNYAGVVISAVTTTGSLSTETVAVGTNTLTINGLAAETTHTLALTFVTVYRGGKSGSSDHTIPVTTQSNRVTAITVSDITENSITLSWTAPEDAGSDYEGVTITAMPTITEATVGKLTTTATITALAIFTDYDFTITTRYSGTKSGADRTSTIRTFSTNLTDLDGDTLIDINSLERLNNMRYNLDLGAASNDGRYKNSTQMAHNMGALCGDMAATKCTGYELTRSLDFADVGSYDNGMVDADWRPTSGNPATATNAGWVPIGDIFATRFEGNGYTISNLYVRNTDASTGATIGLFATIAAGATVRGIGIQNAALYGSDASDDVIGGVAGTNQGSIIASYTHNTTVDGGAGSDAIGGLVGISPDTTGRIMASYASNNTISGGAHNDVVGGLVGRVSNGVIIASYASDGTISGGANDDTVGGLLGSIFNTASAIAVYSTTAVHGNSGDDVVGGLVGLNDTNGSIYTNINFSYTTATVNGGVPTDASDRAYSLYGYRTTVGIGINHSYAFGTTANNDITGGSNGNILPAGVTAATNLTATNTPIAWNRAANDTRNAWDFGTAAQIPALRYANYDGGTDYSCGNNEDFTGIPTMAASPGGPIMVVCGETLLPGQGR